MTSNGLRGRCVVLFALTASACTQPQFAEVTGVVKLDGEPMPDALVQFLPDPEQDTHGPHSSAITDKDGRFRLKCDEARAGAVVGFHRVLVQDARTFPPPRNRKTVGEAPPLPSSRIASRYENASVTPLRQEVTGEPQSITIEVTSK